MIWWFYSNSIYYIKHLHLCGKCEIYILYPLLERGQTIKKKKNVLGKWIHEMLNEDFIEKKYKIQSSSSTETSLQKLDLKQYFFVWKPIIEFNKLCLVSTYNTCKENRFTIQVDESDLLRKIYKDKRNFVCFRKCSLKNVLFFNLHNQK